MGIAALVLGILSCVIALIPVFGFFAVFTALAGIILAIVDLVQKSKKGGKKGFAIAGLILSILSGILMIVSVVILGVGIYNAAEDGILDPNSIFSNNIYSDIPSNNSSNTPLPDTEYTVGQTATIDGLKISFLSANTNFTDYYKYTDIELGYKIIKADFEFENVDTTSNYASSYNFNCYADGYSCDMFYSVQNSTFSDTLAAGRKTKGSVYFKVPSNATEIVLDYTPNSFLDEKVSFKVL